MDKTATLDRTVAGHGDANVLAPSRTGAARDRLAYLPHVDGLRGVAVLLVVAYHAWPWLLPGGFIGVDIFFVISGFIITRQIFAEMQTGQFSFAQFLTRRIRRLLPAAFVCFAATTALASWLLLPRALSNFGRSLASAGLMYANIYFYQTSGYFAPRADEVPLLHTWSLAVEDQFYLSWPLILLGLVWALRSGRTIALAAAGLGILSLLAAEWLAHTDRDFAYYILFPRAFELLAGCAFAIWAPAAGKFGAGVASAASGLGAAVLGLSAVLLNGASTFPGLLALPLVLGTLALIWSGQTASAQPAHLLSGRVPLFFGRISYSLYLWHWPLLALAHYALERPLSTPETLFAVLLSIGLAAASWRWIERPFRHGSWLTVPAWRVFAAATACSTLFAALAIALVVGRGLPNRFSAEVRSFLTVSATAKGYKHCDYNAAALKDDSSCTLGEAHGAKGALDVAVFGDSNARHFGAMLDKLLKPRGLAGRTVAYPGCPPLIGVSRPAIDIQTNTQCTEYQHAILAFNQRNPGLKLVVLSTIWAGYYDGLVYNALGPAGQEGKAVSFEDAVRWTIAALRQRGLRVWLIGTIPQFDDYSERCFVRDLVNHSPVDHCGATKAQVDERQARARKLFSQLAREDAGISHFDVAKLLCDSERCKTWLDGVFLYYDCGHLNDLGAAQLAQYAPFPDLR